jgi:hypothetical protein
LTTERSITIFANALLEQILLKTKVQIRATEALGILFLEVGQKKFQPGPPGEVIGNFLQWYTQTDHGNPVGYEDVSNLASKLAEEEWQRQLATLTAPETQSGEDQTVSNDRGDNESGRGG